MKNFPETQSNSQKVLAIHRKWINMKSPYLFASPLCPVRTTARKEHQSTHQCDDCSVINPVLDSKMTYRHITSTIMNYIAVIQTQFIVELKSLL
jgi:hypothetical protein